MQKLLVSAAILASNLILHAQVTDTTVCEVLKNPASFNSKIVRIKATVTAGFDVFAIKDPSCNQKLNAIWLAYPEGTKGKAGPAATLVLQPAKNFAGTVTTVNRTPVSLEKNKDFKQFDQLLSTPVKSAGLCLGCVKYDVTATLVGRLDGATPSIQRDASGKIVAISGFGNLNAYSARLVLQSVADVAPIEIDYSKPPVQVQNVYTIDQAFLSGTPVPKQSERALDAFGKKGEDNGVEPHGSPNETTEKHEAKADEISPDGVLYNCHFDLDRLTGDRLPMGVIHNGWFILEVGMRVAMAHSGMLIADIRNPEAGTDSGSPYLLEFRAWVITVLAGIRTGKKSLMLPGGYTIYDSSWGTPASLTSNSQSALSSYLANQAMLSQ